MEKKVSYLTQDVPQYFLNLKENIVIGSQEKRFDKTKFEEALDLAEIIEDVEKLPSKENTMLGKHFPKGINLSGGQWQKLRVLHEAFIKMLHLLF